MLKHNRLQKASYTCGIQPQRSQAENVSEVILALSATVDGQTTAHYVADCLKECEVTVSRLGHGVPVGGELDYMDEGTLAAALSSRQKI